MENLAPLNPGDVLAGKYRVERVLGAGAMGVVVLATHMQLDEQVALKFLLPKALADPELKGRFLREARLAVKLKSEHVAKVMDVGTLESGRSPSTEGVQHPKRPTTSPSRSGGIRRESIRRHTAHVLRFEPGLFGERRVVSVEVNVRLPSTPARTGLRPLALAVSSILLSATCFAVACGPSVESPHAQAARPRFEAASITATPVDPDAGGAPGSAVDPAVDTATAPPADASAPMLGGRAWLVAHGVRLRNDTEGYEFDGCSEIAVGSPKRPALMCAGGPVMPASLPTGESLFALRIAVLEGHAMRSVLEVPLSAGPLDPETLDPNEAPSYLRLEHSLDPTGTVVELREVAGQQNTCADVLRPRPRPASAPAAGASLLDGGRFAPTPQMFTVMRALCRAKGRYEWRGQTFVRVSP